jgi:hypothetical protein
MIPLKILHPPRCCDPLLTATYTEYVSLVRDLAPCILGILSGIRFQRLLRLDQK